MFTWLLALTAFLGWRAVTAQEGSDALQPRAALSTAFTFQGSLRAGSAIDGSCDFQFSLWANLTGPPQIDLLPPMTLPVAGGLFAATLDFGDVFQGDARFIETAVRCPSGSGNYELLSPRQELTATPNALFARRAAWEGLVGVPIAFSDGTDDSAPGVPWSNVVIVAKNGGDFDSIQAAIDSVADASATNPYLVWIAPGIYDERVVMKPFVSVAGAGPELTTIRSAGGSGFVDGTTVRASESAVLRDLAVENTGGGTTAVGIYANAVAGGTVEVARVHVTSGTSQSSVAAHFQGDSFATFKVLDSVLRVEETNGTIAVAVGLESFASSEIRNTEVSAQGDAAYGIDIPAGSSMTASDTRVVALGTAESLGISLGSGLHTLEGMTIHAGGGFATGLLGMDADFELRDSSITASSSSSAIGVDVALPSTLSNGNLLYPRVLNSRVLAIGGTSSIGVRHRAGAGLMIADSTIDTTDIGSARAVTNLAFDSGNATIIILRSTLSGVTNSVGAFTAGITYRISSSWLHGPRGATGTYTCVGTMGTTFNALNSACQ